MKMFQVVNRLGYKPKDLSLHLVEISSTMQMVQANKLCVSHREVSIEKPHNYEVSNLTTHGNGTIKMTPNNKCNKLYFCLLPG